MSKQNEEKLKRLIKALYPVIYLQTFEEKRILNIIDKVIKELKDTDKTKKQQPRKLKTWSADAGLINADGSGSDTECTDPTQILGLIKASPENERVVYVLKDFDAYLDDDLVQRHIRSIIEDGLIHVTIIILTPIMNLPIRLQKCISILKWSLPTEEERNGIIAYVKDSNKRLSDKERGDINKAMAGLTEWEAVNVIALQAAIDKKQIVSIDLLNQEKLEIVKKNPVLEIYQPKKHDTFANLAGWNKAKEFILKRKNCFSEDFIQFSGGDAPKGLLLFGVSGCGKSQFAKCIGYEYKLPVVILSLASVMAQSGGIVGQSENWLKQAFDTIEAVAPCVVFMDEIEKGASGMDSSGESDGGMTSRTLTVFLDKLENRNAPFFVVATANSVDKLSSEMVRLGRWDKLMFAGLPNSAEREDVFKIHLNKRNINTKSIDWARLSKKTDTWTGAEIEQSVKETIVESYCAKKPISTSMILNTCNEITPQSKYQSERIQNLIRWAEENGAKYVSSQKADGETAKVLTLVKKDNVDEKK